MTSIYKASEPTDVANYKPFRILPIALKIIKKVVTEQLVDFLNTGHISLHPMQFGFSKHYLTETVNCSLIEQMKSKLDRGGVVGAVFLYLHGAFDTVNYNALLFQLSCFNLSENTIK